MAHQQHDRQVQLAEQQQESPHPMPDPQDVEVEQHPREGDTNAEQQQESPHPMPDPQDLEVEQHPREGDTNFFWPPNLVCVTIVLTICVGIFFRIAEWVYFFVFRHKDEVHPPAPL